MASIFDEYNSLSGSTSVPTQNDIEEKRLLYGVPKVNGTSIFDQYESSAQSSQMVVPEEVDTGTWNPLPQMWHGTKGILPKADLLGSMTDIHQYQKLKPDIYHTESMDREDQAATAAGLPPGWHNMQPQDQSTWQLENYPAGFPEPISDYLGGRAHATLFTENLQRGRDTSQDILSTEQELTKNLVQSIYSLNEHQKNAPARDLEGLKNLSKAKGWEEHFFAIINNPKAALQVGSESIGEFAPIIGAGIAFGIVFGPAATIPIEMGGTFALTQLHGMQQALDHYGIDSSNPTQMMKLMNDPELMDKIKGRMNVYAGIHTALAPLGAWVVGRYLHGIKSATHFSNTMKGAGVIFTVGATEALEEYAALHGSGMWDPDSGPGEVLMEAFVGFGMGGFFALPGYALNANQIHKSNKINKALKDLGLKAHRDENGKLIISVDPDAKTTGEVADRLNEEKLRQVQEEYEAKRAAETGTATTTVDLKLEPEGTALGTPVISVADAAEIVGANIDGNETVTLKDGTTVKTIDVLDQAKEIFDRVMKATSPEKTTDVGVDVTAVDATEKIRARAKELAIRFKGVQSNVVDETVDIIRLNFGEEAVSVFKNAFNEQSKLQRDVGAPAIEGVDVIHSPNLMLGKILRIL